MSRRTVSSSSRCSSVRSKSMTPSSTAFRIAWTTCVLRLPLRGAQDEGDARFAFPDATPAAPHPERARSAQSKDAQPTCSAASQPQHHLRDHVLLDLVRAAIDRSLAVVEIMRRQGRSVVGPDRLLVPAFLERLALEGERVGADRLHGEFGQALLDLRALDLEERALGARPLAAAHRGDHAQIGDLERHQLDFERGDLVAEARAHDERAAAILLLRRDLLQAFQLALRRADAGDAGALIAEQELGVGPALVLLADEVLGRHLDVVEEHLVDFAPAIHGHDGADGDARRLHVDEQEGDALLLLLGAGIGAHQVEDPIGEMRRGRPDLLAVDDVVVAIAYRLGPERGEVGTGARLGEALAPDMLAREDAR